MRFLLVYRGGEVPAEEQAANVAALWSWVDALAARREHVLTIAVGDGIEVGAEGTSPLGDPDGSVFGVSVVETTDLEAAVALTRDWPELTYGGRVDVRSELTP